MTSFIGLIPPIFQATDPTRPFKCIFNPNPDFATDCTGTTNNRKTVDSGNTNNSGPTCYNSTMQEIDMSVLYSPSYKPAPQPPQTDGPHVSKKTPYDNIRMCISNNIIQTYLGYKTFSNNSVTYSGYAMKMDYNKVTYYFISPTIEGLPYTNPPADIEDATFSVPQGNTCYDKYYQEISATAINSSNYEKIEACRVNGNKQTYYGRVNISDYISVNTPSQTVSFGPLFRNRYSFPDKTSIPNNSSSGYLMELSQNKCNYFFSAPTIDGLPYISPPADIKDAKFVLCNNQSGPVITPAPTPRKRPSPPTSTRAPSLTPTPSPPPPPIPPPPPQPITNFFTLHPNKLPITIPSTINPMINHADVYIKQKQFLGDASLDGFWLPEGVPEEGYSDVSFTFNDGRMQVQSNPLQWKGFLSALSKCIELDGSLYPPCPTNTTPSSSSSNTPSRTPSRTQPSTPCSTPSNPARKPFCYAVSTQSNFKGIPITDNSIARTYKYNLVELPNSSRTSNIESIVNNFANNKKRKIDDNFLYCQPQFYTWVKNPPSGTVWNKYAPTHKSTPVATPTMTPSRKPVYVQSTPKDESYYMQCPSEQYPNTNDNPLPELKPPKGFWDKSEADSKFFNFKAQSAAKDGRLIYVYVGIGVAVFLGLGYWYYKTNIAPPDEESTAPVESTSTGETIVPVETIAPVESTSTSETIVPVESTSTSETIAPVESTSTSESISVSSPVLNNIPVSTPTPTPASSGGSSTIIIIIISIIVLALVGIIYWYKNSSTTPTQQYISSTS